MFNDWQKTKAAQLKTVVGKMKKQSPSFILNTLGQAFMIIQDSGNDSDVVPRNFQLMAA